MTATPTPRTDAITLTERGASGLMLDYLALAKDLEGENAALREKVKDVMMECDHLLLTHPEHVRDWQQGVRKIQDKARALLDGKGAG